MPISFVVWLWCLADIIASIFVTLLKTIIFCAILICSIEWIDKVISIKSTLYLILIEYSISPTFTHIIKHLNAKFVI